LRHLAYVSFVAHVAKLTTPLLTSAMILAVGRCSRFLSTSLKYRREMGGDDGIEVPYNSWEE